MQSTHKSDYLFFYRAAHPFSNFHPSKFEVGGVLYHWAEQYLMHRKALHFGDTHAAAQILQARTPADCKSWGRRVQGFDEAEWARVRWEVAMDTVRQKFTRNHKMRAALLATGDKILVEAAPSDRIWGIGYGESSAWANRERWGQNLLGKALMQVRAELRSVDGELSQ